MVVDMEIVRSERAAMGKIEYKVVKNIEMGVDVYGIKIESNLFDRPEEATVSSVTVSPEKINRLFDLCIEHTVLPSTLQDIVEDFIISDET
ncbi:MAG: DUF6514 family protein [Ruminococcus sp.]|jgi:hypothetical protein|nr:DUF6514 family protein [Ruminococcus sp.]